MSIGQYVRELVLEGSLKNEEILTKVKERFPSAKTTYACIAWYKTDLRKKGLIAGRVAKSQDQIKDEITQLEKRLVELRAQVAETETEEA